MKSAAATAIVAGYDDDDPFGPGRPRMLWRHFLNCLPLYDVTLTYTAAT